MIADPASAPARPALGFLRHRSRPRQAAAPSPSPSPSAAPDTRSDAEVRSAIADFVNGRSRHPNRAGASASGASSGPTISFDRPGRSHGVPPVTPSRPAASAPAAPSAPAPSRAPAPQTPASTPSPTISFDRPGRSHGVPPVTPSRPAASAATAATPPAAPASSAASSAASASSSLDLDATSSPPPARRTPAAPARRLPAGAHVRPGQQHLLTVKDPTVLLTRVQSGIGNLGIEAACGPDVGDLRLGAAYQLRSGPTSTVQLAANGNRYAPSSRRPVIVAGRDEYEHLGLDLRQVTDLERMAVYAFSESRTELTWGGTLIVTTFGGGRIELPLESLHPGRIAVLITIYNVEGRLVVRAEMETVAGDVREAARGYGFDRITWRDDRTPVD